MNYRHEQIMMEVSFCLVHASITALRPLTQLPPDRAQVIMEDALVKPFRNAPTDDALEVPESVKNSFKAENGSVAGLLVEKQRSFAHFALRLSDTLLLPLNIYPGEYSIFHELAVYMHVSSSSRTVVLLLKYCSVFTGDGPPRGNSSWTYVSG